MGMKKDVLALADQVEATIGGCGECIASNDDGRCLSFDTFECSDAICRVVAERLREIAARDADDVTTVTPYDLLPHGDLEAIAWVRDHGGVDEVERRLMPDGMEWPRFEDGELVRWNDEYANGKGSVSPLRHVHLYADGRTMLGKGQAKVVLAPGERVKRPSPKVLDADGVEIRVGDTVYGVGWDEPLTVKGFADDGRVLMDYHDEDSLGYKPSSLTHERPDSWGRLERELADEICGQQCGLISPEEAADAAFAYVLRARALAERGA